jgi:hypothetical protein
MANKKHNGYVLESSALLEAPSVVTPAGEPGADGKNRVDNENKIIYGVKVIGRKSNNPARLIGADSDATHYTYTLEALQRAIPLYEGINVFVDHLKSNIDDNGRRLPSLEKRRLKDKFGQLRNVRVTESGMFADLHYLESHELSGMITEAAQRMPDLVALSHYAISTFEIQNDGEVLIVDIPRVESVDLIGETPGTTTGLFESLEKGSHRIMDTNQEKTGTAGVTEAEETINAAAVGAPTAPAAPTVDAESLRGKIAALLANADLDDATLTAELTEIIAAAVTSEAEETAGEETTGEKAAETPAEKAAEPVAEESRRRIANLEALNKASILLGRHGVVVTESRQLAVASLKTEAQRLEIIEQFKSAAGTVSNPLQVRSAPPAVFTQESQHAAPSGDPSKDLDEIADRLTHG